MNPGVLDQLSSAACGLNTALCWLSQTSLGLMDSLVLAQVDQPAAASSDIGQAPTQPSPIIEFLASPLNLILISAILFMFLVARPQQKKAQQQQQALAEIKKNDRVVTQSGIHGIVVQINPEVSQVTIRIDENTGARMTVNRDAIATITPSDSKE